MAIKERAGRQRESRTIKPMLATLVSKPFDDKDWIFEVKYDGFRAIAEIGRRVRLYSRNEIKFEQFAPINEALSKLKHAATLDGEICAVDSKGISRFQLLQNYQKTGKGRLVYFVFDILKLDGKDLHHLPLIDRKEILRHVIQELHKQSKQAALYIKYSDHVEEQGKKFFQLARKQDLEGIMAKEKSSEYVFGRRAKSWLKIKNHMVQEAVIGGFTEPRGARKKLGALVLGVYNGNGLGRRRDTKLTYIGHTGGGFNDRLLQDIYRLLKAVERKNSPFNSKFKVNAPVHWVEPKYVAEISFQEWTEDGHMRQPIFEGLRQDKDPKDVKRELPI